MATTAFSLLENKSSTENTSCYFALCESCYWSATILSSHPDIDIEHCPVCSGDGMLSLIPLNIDESYRIALSSRGIEMEFARSG